MLTAAGCGDTTYVMTYNNGVKINAGVYLYSMFIEMSNQFYYSGYAQDFMDREVDGQPMSDYLVDQAKKSAREFAAVKAQFEKLGLSLSEQEEDEIRSNVKLTWDSNSELFELEGISKESLELMTRADYERQAVFNYYYGDEGIERPSDDELVSYMNDAYVRYKSIRISKAYDSDESAREERNKEYQALRDEFLEKAKKVDFAGFDDIIAEFDEYEAQKAAEDAAAEEAAQQEAALESAADTEDSREPVADEDSVAEVKAPEEPEGEEETSEEPADEVTTDGEDAVLLTDADTDGGEPDPYANEILRNYANITATGLESEAGKLMTAVMGLEVGKAEAYEDDSAYYIIIKGDVSERSAEYAAENRESLVSEMKDKEFQAKIDEWVKEIGVVENTDAVRRYTAKKVFDIQNDYYESLSK